VVRERNVVLSEADAALQRLSYFNSKDASMCGRQMKHDVLVYRHFSLLL
jgi:hypothetical protein